LELKAPFPYFGGKKSVASLIWARLGDVDNFIEPFCGSAAVLIGRPSRPRIETINDVDCYVANFWRATLVEPNAVAIHADHPVNETDLHSRHRWLVLSPAAADFRERMRADPDYFDAKVAGWWAWGLCCWIGSGWCTVGAEWDQRPQLEDSGGRGVLGDVPDQLPKLAGGGKKTKTTSYGGSHIHADQISEPSNKMPRLNGARKGDEYYGGLGVHLDKIDVPDKRPILAGPANESGRREHYGLGVNAMSHDVQEKRPQLHTGNSEAGRGVHSKGPSDTNRPQLADAHSRGRGVHANDAAGTCEQRREWLIDWFGRLRDRLRTVRVCCGDWKRVCSSPSVTTRLGLTGIFLDPPYAKTRTDGSENRSGDLYANDKTQDVDQLVRDVRSYCLERGADPRMRIALAGYEGEGHETLEQAGWSVVAWKAAGGYGNRTQQGKENAARERIWFSPHCIQTMNDRTPLFAALDDEN
jgi:hypothetical protein